MFNNNVLDLSKQKVFYLYDFITDFKKFKEQFPSKGKCYSSLTGKKVSNKECFHVRKISSKFQIKTMNYYHDLYIKCDALLLADVFKKFRNNSLKNHRLCPSHYMSVPVISWNAMYNKSKVELELISDPDM